MRGPTSKQQAFAMYRAVGFPATTAARLAGYRDNGKSGIRVIASRLARRADILVLVRLYEDVEAYKALRALLAFREPLDALLDLYDRDELETLAAWRGAAPATRERIATILDSNFCDYD